MYRLLIVDDEPFIADKLYDLFYNIRKPDLEVYKAYSGVDALAVLNKRKFDVVLSDICMPDIDGLQLLEIIRGNWPACRVIFFTGYNEFDYIYKATQYDGVTYLLKTENFETIIEAVNTQLNETEKDLQDYELIIKAKQDMYLANSLLQKEFISELIAGDAQKVSQEQLNQLGISLDYQSDVFMIIGSIDNLQESLSSLKKSEYFYSIKRMAEQMLAPQYRILHVVVRHSILIWICQLYDTPESCAIMNSMELREHLFARVCGALESIQEQCRQTLNVTVSFVLSKQWIGWDEVCEKFTKLRHLLGYRYELGMEVLLKEEEIGASISSDDNRAGVRGLQVQSVLNKLQKLEPMLMNKRREEFLIYFKDIMKELEKLINYSDSLKLQAIYAITLFFITFINSNQINDADASIIINITDVIKFNPNIPWSRVEEEYSDFVNRIFELEVVQHQNREITFINNIKEYIINHLSEDISLDRLSEIVFCNPKYLSRMFYQISGIHLSDYICEAKLDKVKMMLKDEDIKINKIANAVGYLSPPNFNRFFKRATNMTPQEYREQLIK